MDVERMEQLKFQSRGLKLREIVVMASISVVFGVIYLVWIFFGNFVRGIGGPVAFGAIAGLWVMAPIICAYIIRKPGVALAAEMIAAGTEVMFGSVNASLILALGFFQGIGVEIVFAMFLYRSYRLPVLMLAGMVGMLGNFFTVYFILGYGALSNYILGLTILAMLVSGALLGGWASKKISDALCKTGVLNNFALGRLRRQQMMKDE